MSLGNTLKKNFAKNLQNLRMKSDLTQAKLADALNEKFKEDDIQLKRTSIVNYETEEAMPRIDALYCIAKYFGTTIDQIISPTMDNPLLTNFLNPGPISAVSTLERYHLNEPSLETLKNDLPGSGSDIDGILTTCVDGILYRKFFLEFFKTLYQRQLNDAPTTETKKAFEKTFFKTFLSCQINKSKYLQDLAKDQLNEQEFAVFMAFQDNNTTIESVAKANDLTEPQVVEIFNKAQHKLSSVIEEKPTSRS